MTPSNLTLQQIFEAQVETLALSLEPGTVHKYRVIIKQFFRYLHAAFPQLDSLAQLRRDPHLLGWFRWLCDHNPPLCNTTRRMHLISVRRLLHDLAANGHPLQPDLIRRDDFPPLPQYLPRPLSPEDDQRLQRQLRQADDLYANALLLIRATGIRCGECTHLAFDCLRQLDHDHWALHVPLGKLHTERLVPADQEVRRLIARILNLRTQAPMQELARSAGWLLPRRPPRVRTSPHPKGDFFALSHALSTYLNDAAERAWCSAHVSPHQLRHSFATEMIRLGVSLPALMQLMGHKDLRMTLRYVQVTQTDLQREFQLARQSAPRRHLVPQLPLPASSTPASPNLAGIRQSLAATRHLLEIYRYQVRDEAARRKLQRLDKRLLAVAFQLAELTPPEK